MFWHLLGRLVPAFRTGDNGRQDHADHHTANVIPVIRYIGPLRGAQVWTPDQRGMQKPVTQNCGLKSLGSGAKIAASPAAALSPGAGD